MITIACVFSLLILFFSFSCKNTKGHTEKIKETKRVLKNIKKELKHK